MTSAAGSAVQTKGNADPLRVVHVTFGLDVGGLEKLLLEMARVAPLQRIAPLFVSLGYSGAVGEELRRLGFPVVCLHRPAGFHPTILTQLVRLIRSTGADVVHTHDARAMIYGAPAGRLARAKRVIHTQHGQALGLSPRQRWLAKTAARAVHRFVCVSRDAETIARDLLEVPAGKLRTIYNGIDVDRFLHAAVAEGGDDRGPVVTVARLSPEKGVDVLVEAMALARSRAPDLRLEVAGDGPCRAELERRAKALGVGDCVRFLGQIDDVPDFLRRARLFVLPSRSEGIALTLLEAMASGVPIVATRVGGSAEVLMDDQNGVLTPPGEPAAMANAIVRLWDDPDERDRLAAAAKWRVSELFTVERMIDAYARLYRGLELDQPRDKPARTAAANTA